PAGFGLWMSNVCAARPVLSTSKVTVPHGTDDGVRTKVNSYIFTLTCVDPGLVHGPPTPDTPGVPVPGVTAFGATVAAAAFAFDAVTTRPPFIPAAAWPGTVEEYVTVPAFLKTTVIAALFPGAR